MIAIFFALSQEVASLKSQVNILKKIRYANAVFYQAEFCGFPVTLVQTGVGKNVSEAIHQLSTYFRIQLMVSSTLPYDASAVDIAIALSSAGALKFHCGDILSVDKIIRQSSLKTHIGNQTSAIAVDMESFAIAERANAMGIPFIAVRAISDGADEDMEIGEDMVTRSGNINISATARYLLNKPHHIPYLNRLRKQTKLATHTLSSFFPNFITQIYNSLLT